MTSKSDQDRIARKRDAVATKIKEIAPHADTMLGMLDETRIDMLVIALRCGDVQLKGEDE